MSNQPWNETVPTDVLQAIYFAQRYPMDFERVMKERMTKEELKDLHSEEVKASNRQTLNLNLESVGRTVSNVKNHTRKKVTKFAADIAALPSRFLK